MATKSKHSGSTGAPTITHQYMPNPPSNTVHRRKNTQNGKKHRKTNANPVKAPLLLGLDQAQRYPLSSELLRPNQTQKKKYLYLMQKIYGRIKLHVQTRTAQNLIMVPFLRCILCIISKGKSRSTPPFRNNRFPRYEPALCVSNPRVHGNMCLLQIKSQKIHVASSPPIFSQTSYRQVSKKKTIPKTWALSACSANQNGSSFVPIRKTNEKRRGTPPHVHKFPSLCKDTVQAPLPHTPLFVHYTLNKIYN